MPIRATKAGKVLCIFNLSMLWRARSMFRMLYPKYPFNRRLRGPQSLYESGNGNGTLAVQAAANCLTSSVQLPWSKVRVLRHYLARKQCKRQNSRLHLGHEPPSFLSDASPLHKLSYVIQHSSQRPTILTEVLSNFHPTERTSHTC